MIFSQIENSIRRIIPKDQLSLIVDNIGLAGALNNLFNNSGTIRWLETARLRST